MPIITSYSLASPHTAKNAGFGTLPGHNVFMVFMVFMLSCRYIWNQTASRGFESFCVPVYVCVGVCVVRGVVLCGCVFVVASVWWCLCGGGVVILLHRITEKLCKER